MHCYTESHINTGNFGGHRSHSVTFEPSVYFEYWILVDIA
jgi:hypothetical protein